MKNFDEQLSRSSLGTEGAKQLIARTPRQRATEALERAKKISALQADGRTRRER